MTWVRVLLTSIAVFVAWVLCWQIYILISSPVGTAHGAGLYRPQGLMFMIMGGLFFSFGLFLKYR